MYAPTSKSSGSFKITLVRLWRERKLIVSSIKVVTWKDGESNIGKFGTGKRNERANMLVNYSERYQMASVCIEKQ